MSAPEASRRSARRILRDLIALFSAELLAKVAGFAAFAWLARALSPESYGGVELAVQIALSLGMLVDFGLGPIGARAVAASPERGRSIAAEITTLRLLLALPALGIANVLASTLDLADEARMLVRITALSLLAAPLVLSWLFQGLGRMLWVAGGQLLRMSVFAVLVVTLVSSDANLLRVGAAELAAAFTMGGWYLLAQGRAVGRPALGASATRLRILAAASLPVGLGRGLAAIQQYAPTLIVTQLSGAGELAWYAAAQRLVTSLGSFVDTYLFNLYPQLVKGVGAGGSQLRETIRASFHVSAWLGVAVGLATLWLAEPVTRLVFGAPFAAAAVPLRIAIWALPLTLLGGHARFALLAAGAQRAELAANAVGAGVTIAFAAASVARFGPEGAAAALVAGAAATWIAAHALARERLGPLPIAPALRPLLAAAALAPLGRFLPLESDLARTFVGLAAFAGLALLIDPTLRRDAARLRARGPR